MRGIGHERYQELFKRAKQDLERAIEPAGGIWSLMSPEEARRASRFTDEPILVARPRVVSNAERDGPCFLLTRPSEQ